MKIIVKLALLLMLSAMVMGGCGDDDKDPPKCQAAPVCPAGYEQTEQCPQDACCKEVTVCGETIQCWTDDAILCPVPECPDGLTPVEEAECGAKEHGLLECETVLGGMDPLYCADVSNNCPADITCPDGYEVIDVCPQDSECKTVTVCDETIQCFK